MAVLPGRMTAITDEPFALFIIGMRINRWWKPHRWMPVAAAMPKMLMELERNPDLGYLGGKMWFSRTIVLIQYWRSVEHLNAYASAREAAHLPAWAAFNRSIAGSGDVGVYHETYKVAPGTYENVYVDMPRTLMGQVFTPVEAAGALARAEGRMGRA